MAANMCTNTPGCRCGATGCPEACGSKKQWADVVYEVVDTTVQYAKEPPPTNRKERRKGAALARRKKPPGRARR